MAIPTADGRAAAELAARLKAEALRLGFDAAGIAPLGASEHAELYRAWLAAGRHGDMAYLARPDAVVKRADPTRAWGVRSALVALQSYAPADDEGAGDPSRGLIARYARGRDYHKVVKKRLLGLLRWLEAELGRELPAARAYVDTGPVLERELARRAGLGWFGRNTMLIDPRRGSYFFIGALLLEIELPADAAFEADRCGTCRACLDACPTDALLGRNADGAPVMDATRCISYLTIEQRGPIPEALRPAIGNRVYGCDICQEVCPWNSPKIVDAARDAAHRRRDRGQPDSDSAPAALGSDSGSSPAGAPASRRGGLPGTEAPSLVRLMRMTREEWDRWTRGSAIRRAGYAGLKRNVAVAVGNWLACADEPPEEAVAALRAALEDESDLVREHAGWALGRVELGQRSTARYEPAHRDRAEPRDL